MGDEDLRISSDQSKKDSWEDSSSLLSESSSEIYESIPAFQLQLIQKRESKSKRPLINSTKFERISFYNSYTAPAWKPETMSNQFVNYNSTIWLNIGNLIFKYLSHNFVHIFLASYSPDEHIFLTKMVPLCIGHKFLVVAASLFDVFISLSTAYRTFDYFLLGLLFKNPWNRCSSSSYYDEKLDKTIHCYELEEFAQQVLNGTHRPIARLYINEKNELFTLAQVHYLRSNPSQAHYLRHFSLVFLWCIIVSLKFNVSRKFFWKVLNCAHWSIIFINISTILYILLDQHGERVKESVFHAPGVNPNLFWLSDINIIEGITTSPPIAHILSSRSTQPIHPSEDSTAIGISNTAFYIFKIYLSAKMTNYCKYVIGAPMHELENPIHSFFLVWPIFFSYFYLGDLYSLVFFGLNSLLSMFCTAVIVHCFIEMVAWEWVKVKSWMVIIALCICITLGYFSNLIFQVEFKVMLYIYTKGFASLFEVIFLYMFYPLRRLIDDYTFHYGEPPTKLRKLSLQVLPFYYMLKFFGLMYAMYDKQNRIYVEVSQHMWSWYLMLVPLVAGLIFTVYRQIFVRKASILQLFNPVPTWGPKDFSTRQLRKLYDSRVYIKSDVPRALSRYLLSRAEPKSYKLDVRYDLHRKADFRFRDENERKKVSGVDPPK